ncbi:serine/threonine protein kinase [Actinomadura sp. LCR2-06]|uniref:Serine/threonine protein kinase n=1 Tax=Actinomadura violacea TaxID=2819934 RepID=A0ABS3RNY8_9ACTN|nr:serine/threonine protein kinase [Actinomadura violacea]
MLPTDPASVGPYRLAGRLGTGGQGTVYLGESADGRRVAVKLLHPHLIVEERARARFLGEVEIAERVAPFCTAQVLGSGVLNEQPYIVSEFVDGPSLHESVREAGPRAGAALERLALNTATALAAIHQAGVVHRDFKPGNVLLGPDGPVVIDFGIARALDLSRSITTSQAVGSPGYMAPEQIEGEGVGPAADMFAWAATMVFAATAARAFRGDTIPAVMRSILHDEPDLGALDGRLGGIVRACLDKDPAGRPTAAEVGDGLRALPTTAWLPADASPTRPDPAPAPPAADAKPARRRARRLPLLIGAAVIALVAVLGVTYTLLPSDEGGTGPDASGESRPGTSAGGVPGSPGPAGGRHAGSPPTATATTPAGTGRPAPQRRSGSPGPATKPSTPKKAPSSPQRHSSAPRTLGTVSGSDMNRYCQSRGFSGSGGTEGGYWCYGPGGTPITTADVCRWKYPGHSNVTADGSTCKGQ